MQRAWLREFNALGLQLRPQAAKLVASFLQECKDPEQMVEALVEHTKAYMRNKHGVVECVIDAEVILAVIECLKEAGDHVRWATVSAVDIGDGVQIYNAFTDVHPYRFDRASKSWYLSPHQPRLLPHCSAKAKIYADRYHILLQRLLMQGRLVTEADVKRQGSLMPNQRLLTHVESLVGNPGKKLTFGLLTKVQDGSRKWTIEDLHCVFNVELELKESDHLMTDGSFVLAEGVVEGEMFKVKKLEVPEAVPRLTSLKKDQVPQGVFGGRLNEEQLRALEDCEAQNADGMYAVLSDVLLDNPRVLEKLDILFNGFESSEFGPPAAYVLMGSFCSLPFVATAESVAAYRESFERLRHMLQGLANHVKRGTRFIFIPGPNDPGSQTLPKMPLPNYLTADLGKLIPNVTFATNPCRIRHFSRELVFFRHDVLRLLRRHEVIPMRTGDNGSAATVEQLREEMVRFLFDQAHLLPLPLVQSNVLWEFDHTLRLYPLPHAVFVGGSSSLFEYQYQDSRFCSVGPFYRDASFFTFTPVKDINQESDVPDAAA